MTSTQIGMGVLFVIAVILFSKLFCSYICPIGTISEWLGKLGSKLKVRFTIKGIVDKILRSLKYILLFITLYYTFDSNELFCKKFDPYYAIATGFDMDVVVLYAAISIALVILGSVFIRLFWCKYICPLGAISNIFKFTIFFVAVLGTYILLLVFGVNISYVWPIAIATVGGYIIELIGQKSRIFPVARITRDEDTCTNCQLCSIKCPQAIDVASVKVVKHVDCNLCSECISVCPVNDTIQINKKKSLRWLPIIATVVLVVAGIFMGMYWEVPTIDQRWGDDEEMANSAVFTQSGLKNIKCYGSSMAFASKMKKMKGVNGVATYVDDHRVKIYYDPSVLSEDKIMEELFTPMKVPIRPIAKDVEDVRVVSLLLENFFDTYDFNYLSILLKQKTDALGLQSEYACPVIVKIYFPANSDLDEESMIDIIQSKKLEYELSTGAKNAVELGYKVATEPEYNIISRAEYIKLLFKPYKQDFNKRATYTESVIDTLRLPLGKNSSQAKRYPYLVSHLSNDNGIVEFNAILDSDMVQKAQILFVDTMTNSEAIIEALQQDTLIFTYRSGKIGKTPNLFNFSNVVDDMKE